MFFTFGKRPNQKLFPVHTEVVCRYSSVITFYIDRTGLTRYPLFTKSEDAARLLMKWLYSQKLEVLQLEDDWENIQAHAIPNAAKEEDAALVELWVLADKLDIGSLQNQVIKAIDDVYKDFEYIFPETIALVYKITSGPCELRELFVRIIANDFEPNTFMKEEKGYPRELLSDLILLGFGKLGDNQFVYQEPMAFYVYDTEVDGTEDSEDGSGEECDDWSDTENVVEVVPEMPSSTRKVVHGLGLWLNI